MIVLFTIFVLSLFLGFELIRKIPVILHTPLMSGSNAISGITLVGSVASAISGQSEVARVLASVAIAMASVNVVGGFLVTHRMLKMFKKESEKQ